MAIHPHGAAPDRPAIALALGLGLWNVAINRLIPERFYVPANLAITVLIYRFGRTNGLSRKGIVGSVTTRSAATSITAAAAVGAATALSSRIPMISELFEDDRVDPDDVAYQTFVRIPLGTVVLEEVAFRGVLPALLGGEARHRPSPAAAIGFGFWHVLPTLRTLDINAVTKKKTRLGAVTGAVVATTAVGLAFDAMRLRSRTIATPSLVHWAANATAYALAARRKIDPTRFRTSQLG